MVAPLIPNADNITPGFWLLINQPPNLIGWFLLIVILIGKVIVVGLENCHSPCVCESESVLLPADCKWICEAVGALYNACNW